MKHIPMQLWNFVRQYGFWCWVVFICAGMIAGIWYFWGMIQSEAQTGFSEMIRNIALVWGGLIGLGLAAWRSVIAERQSEIAQGDSFNDQYQKAVELLDGDKAYIRIGAIHAIRHLAFQNPHQFCEHAMSLLRAFQDSRKIAKGKGNASDMVKDREFMVAQKAIEDLRFVWAAIGKGEHALYDRAMYRVSVMKKRSLQTRTIDPEET